MEKTHYLPIDITTRLISLVAVIPLRQDILSDQLPFEDETSDRPEGWFKTAGELGDRLLPGFSAALKKSRDVVQRVVATPGAKRVKEIRGTMVELKHVLHRFRSYFSYIDFVEGGLQGLHTEEPRSFNEDEINKDCDQYWVALKGLLVLDIELKFDALVLKPLQEQVVLTDMREEMDDLLKKLEADPKEAGKIMDMTDTAEVEEEYKLVSEQHDTVKTALTHLEKVLGCEEEGSLTITGVNKATPEKNSTSLPEVWFKVPLPPRIDYSLAEVKRRSGFEDLIRKDISHSSGCPLDSVFVKRGSAPPLYHVRIRDVPVKSPSKLELKLFSEAWSLVYGSDDESADRSEEESDSQEEAEEDLKQQETQAAVRTEVVVAALGRPAKDDHQNVYSPPTPPRFTESGPEVALDSTTADLGAPGKKKKEKKGKAESAPEAGIPSAPLADHQGRQTDQASPIATTGGNAGLTKAVPSVATVPVGAVAEASMGGGLNAFYES